MRSAAYGLRVGPLEERSPVGPLASSWVVVLPMMMAPASLSCRTHAASSWAMCLAK